MKKPIARPKVREPQRAQGTMRFDVTEDLLPTDHPARLLWNVLGRFDLSGFLVDTESAQKGAGRPEISPRLKLTLWFYGISRGIGSAREIAARTRTDLAFQWIVGDLSIGHHALSAFRAEHGAALEKLFTDVIAALVHKDLISLEVIAQDGMRVRASAGAPSFRTHASLLECREQAALHLKAVLAQADDPEVTKAQRARRETAARDFAARVEAAIEACASQREAHPDAVARGSTTDADARVMKMADHGFRPGFNVQYGVVGDKHGGPRTIVGVRVTNGGNDFGSLIPMVEQVKKRTGRVPKAIVADSNHAQHAELHELQKRGIVPIVQPRKARPGQPTRTEADQSALTAAWRAHVETAEGKEIARQRGGLSELANAWQRNHGLRQFLVRGLSKTLNVAVIGALAFNLLQHSSKLLA